MEPDPRSVLPWLRQLQRVRLVEVSARLVVDVERLLRLRKRWSPDELGVCLASLLAHDELSWRKIEESFREWYVDQRQRRLPPERVAGVVVSREVQPSVESAPPDTGERPRWIRRVVKVAAGWKWAQQLTRQRWAAMLGLAIVGVLVLALSGAEGLFELDQVIAKDAAEQDAAPATKKASEPSTKALPASPTPEETMVLARFEEVEPARPGPVVESTEIEEVKAIEPWWATGGLLLASVILMGLAVRWWTSIEQHRRRRLATVKAAEHDRVRRLASAKQIATPYHIERSSPLSPEVIEDAATLLARLTEEQPGHELDIEPTIERTVSVGGRLDPVFVPAQQRVRLLILVDVEIGDHPDLHRVEHLLAQWRRGGLDFVRYDFEHQPGQLRAHPHAPPLDLATVWAGVPLLVLSRWARPEDYEGRMVWLELLAAWPNRVWLDLDPRPVQERSPHARDIRATVVGSGLPRFAFTEAGLLACARTLASGGEHAAPVEEPEPVDLDAMAPMLELWAACACLVPDPTWPQLQAIRERIDELREVFTQGGDVHRLIEWLRGYAVQHGATEPEVDDTASRALGYGERLVLSRRCRYALKAALRRYDARTFRCKKDRMEFRARGLLVEQLLAADVQDDAFEKLKRDLKVAVHRSVMDHREARVLLNKFGHQGVARELQGMVAEEETLQCEGLKLGGRWVPVVWEGLQGRFGEGEGAYLRDLLRPRIWTWRRLGVVAVMLGVVAMSYGPWWWTRTQSVEREVTRVEQAVRPALFRVERIEVTSLPCDEEVALKDEAPMKLKCLPGSVFLMGSPLEEEGHEGDEALHRAEVAPFAIGIHEVTVAQWRAVMGNMPSDCDIGCEDDHPVYRLSWEDSVQFLNRFTQVENKKLPVEKQLTVCYTEQGGRWTWVQECSGYRLPTEAEWEYAARSSVVTAYGFGSEMSELDKYAWYIMNSSNKVHTVGNKMPNTWGLYDMHGNVWEWVWDWYGPYPWEIEKGHRGPADGRSRVLRGGSFISRPEFLRSAYRRIDDPSIRDRYYGLRCARSLSAEPLDASTP